MSTNQEQVIETRDPQYLHPHPSLKHIPAPPKDGPEVVAMADTIQQHDQYLLPIVVDDQNRILTDDGRLRWMGAKRLGMTEVPVVIQPHELGPSIVLQALVHRAHLTKSALAYLAIPLLKPALEAARVWRVECLKNGHSSVAHSVRYGKNLDDLAQSVGIGSRLFDLAVEVHREFDNDSRKYAFVVQGGPEDGQEVMQTLREHFEPLILRQMVDSEHEDQRPIGLGGVMKAIGSIRATKGEPKRTASQLELFTGGFSALQKRFRYWPDLAPAEKRQAAEFVRNWIESMPDDLRAVVEKALEDLS